jgi:SAM-dependent methyltransferase
MEERYLTVNRANWNSRVPLHALGYGLDKFRDDPAWLSEVVQFDRPRLGDIAGLDVVHLQCHIGTDTLSLARLGASRVTGLDFSELALDVARKLARDCGAELDWTKSDVYGAVEALGEARFDLVYTGIGALCWLPSIERWANVVSRLLKPGGRLFIREGHPIVWALSNPRPDGLLVIEYPYFETAEGVEFVEPKTYVEHEGELSSPTSIAFNHGLGEIFTALMRAGLTLTAFEEHQSLPWNPYGDSAVMGALREYSLREKPDRLPGTYTLQAQKLR